LDQYLDLRVTGSYTLFSKSGKVKVTGRKICGLIPQKAISPPHGGVIFFRQTNFYLDDDCVKFRISARIG
jgi:hypothetical protein